MTRILDTGRKEPASGNVDRVVAFLHGYGADGADLLGLADPLAPHLPDTLFLAPNAPERCVNNPMGFQWFPIPWLDGSSEQAAETSMEASVDLLNGYLDHLAESTGVPAKRTCLYCFSQGTMMGLHVAARREKAFAGVVGFSGRLIAPERLSVDTVSKPPVLLVHGDHDDVVPFASMGQASTALLEAGFEVYNHVMQGTGHGISPDGLSVSLAFLRERFSAKVA